MIRMDEMTTTLKIKINEDVHPMMWYKAGQILEVAQINMKPSHRKSYVLLSDYRKGKDAEWRHVYPDDCTVLND